LLSWTTFFSQVNLTAYDFTNEFLNGFSHELCLTNSSNSALASCKSFVSNPSVNQP
jgi:hypothetical protein